MNDQQRPSVAPVRPSLVGAAALATLLTFGAASGQDAASPPVAPSLDAALALELERAQSALDTIEARQADLEARRERLLADVAAARARLAAMDTRVRMLADGERDADRLYDEIVAELERQRRLLESALDELRAPLDVPGFRPRLDLHRLQRGVEAGSVETLRDRYATIERQIDDTVRLARELRWSRVAERGDVVAELNRVRIDALGRVSPSRRGELLGFTRDGVQQVRREAAHVALATRYWVESRVRALRTAVSRAGDLYAVGTAGLTLLKVLVVLVVWLYVRMRLESWLDGMRRATGRAVDGARRRRRIDSLFRGVRALAPWGLFLLAVAALRRALGAAADWPELDLLLRLAMLYGGYRLTIDALHALVLGLARRYRLRVGEERTDRILRTVRSLTRFAFGLAVLLALAEQVLGRGALYHVVLGVAWLLFAALMLRLVARWRDTIADTYLRQDRGGALAGLVRRTRERWYGVFVAVAALVFLAARGAAVMARDFALGFDQTRRALAFVFRRKMEKAAAIQGYADVDPEDVPAPVRAAFSEEPVEDELAVDHYPGLDRLADSVERWFDDGTGGSFMLTGDSGAGKTSWLARARRIGDEADHTPWTFLSLEDRVRTPKRLATTLAEALALEGADGDLRAVQTALLEGSPRRIVVDRSQNLFLGVVGGFRTMEAFVNLMEATCRRVYWLCAMNSHAWHTLVSVRPDLNVFRRSQPLERWTEDRIRELIRVRSAACGLEVTYEDLFADRLDRLDARVRAEDADRGYTRLLWDYADGNPRAALHFWLRSLVPDGPGRARVRLFRSPDAAEIEALGEQGLFILAALAAHENLTLHEAAEVTRYPVPLCRIRFERMRDLGVLTDAERRARITTHWQRVVHRTLRRRNLLAN